MFIHGSAIIDEGASIGEGSRIWHFSHVCSGAKIGRNVTVGQNVFIANQVQIGNDCKIQNNVSVYDGVTLGDGVFCGPSMVFTNVTNPRANIERKDQFRKTNVKSNATLGANCTVVCGITIGCCAFIAAGAVVTTDVKDFALIAGVPGKQIGWMTTYGERIPLPLSGRGSFTCPHTGSVYELNEDEIRVIS